MGPQKKRVIVSGGWVKNLLRTPLDPREDVIIFLSDGSGTVDKFVAGLSGFGFQVEKIEMSGNLLDDVSKIMKAVRKHDPGEVLILISSSYGDRIIICGLFLKFLGFSVSLVAVDGLFFEVPRLLLATPVLSKCGVEVLKVLRSPTKRKKLVTTVVRRCTVSDSMVYKTIKKLNRMKLLDVEANTVVPTQLGLFLSEVLGDGGQ